MPALTPVYRYRARLLYIHDGDTLDVEVDLGFRVHVRTPVRLYGLNAPELATPEGRDALAWVSRWMADTGIATNLVIDSAKDGDWSGDKYGRWLAVVHDTTGRCLNDDLLASGHAVPMAG